MTVDPSTNAPLDADLAAWRDAAVRGGLPTAARADRWQPVRAGLVSLWEFEVAEYWFARGWAQLTGRNETGKSSLMALTTLIPWLGDTSTGNIDTLGEHGKRFRYYVEPTTTDGDRRAADAATNIGWLWVEYGRIVDGEPVYITTALQAQARRASGQLTLNWCTARGPRVRDGLDLIAGATAVPAKDLAGVPGFTVHRVAADYRAWCARELLGAGTERLDAVGKLLRVTRTPKLGERLNIAFVSAKMRDALPELDRAEIDALAEGWDQLDAVRADAEAARAAASTVARFLRSGWTPWALARLRRSADDAAAARSVFDNVTRREREARTTLEEVQGESQENEADTTRVTEAIRAGGAALTELQESTRYLDAAARVQRLADARDRLARAAQAAREADDRHDAGSRRAHAAREEAAAAEELQRPARAERAAAQEAAEGSLRDAGLAAFERAVRQHDHPRVRQALRDRRAGIAESRRRHDAFAQADREAELREESAAEAGKAATLARAAAQESWDRADRARDDVARSLAAWAAAVTPPPESALVDGWLAALPSSSDLAGTPISVAVRRDWFEPAHRGAAARVAQAEQRSAAAAEAVLELRAQRARIEAETEPDFPAPPGWVRRDRPAPGSHGAPLWWLVNPREGRGAEHLAALEAALAAAGLLDAWVTGDGVYVEDRDGDDAVVDLAGAPEPAIGHLGDLLDVPGGTGAAGERARQLLARVALVAPGLAAAGVPAGPGDPGYSEAAGYAVSVDGHWRTPLQAGRARPPRASAEWLGAEARRAGRARRLAELRDLLATAKAAAEAAAAELADARAAVAALDGALARCPEDTELRRALDRAADRDEAADGAEAAATAAAAAARRAREIADTARARLLEHAAEHGLPLTPEGLTELVDALHALELAISRLEHAVRVEQVRQAAAEAAAARAADADADLAALARTLAERRSAAAQAQATHDALAATVDADVREVLDEVDARAAHLKELRTEADALRERALEIRQTVGSAQERLSNVAAERVEATVARDEAFAGFRRLVDAGLAVDAGLDLPQAGAATVEAVRAQVAATRDAVRLPGWPDGAQAQQEHIDRAWRTLVTEGEKARVVLEERGRTLRITEADGLPRIEVVVDSTGSARGPHEAAALLATIRDDLDSAYDRRVQETLGELLGSTFIEHLRGHLVAARRLIASINHVLRDHPTGTARTALRIRLDPREGATAQVWEALEEGTALLDDSVSAAVREFLRARVDGAREAAAARGEADWGERLAEALDYRGWVEISLEKRSGDAGRWTPLTPASYAGLSGGARAVMLMLPLVATLAALYGSMPGAPRPLWLDEAFDGLDVENRATVLDLFREFDLDVLVAGPGRLVNVPTVPAAAIYQVVRAPDPHPGADLLLELWAADTLTVVDLPPASSREPAAGGQAGDGGPADLWSTLGDDEAGSDGAGDDGRADGADGESGAGDGGGT